MDLQSTIEDAFINIVKKLFISKTHNFQNVFHNQNFPVNLYINTEQNHLTKHKNNKKNC